MDSRYHITIIIPTLDEEKRIVERLQEVAALEGVHEFIVVDGGSKDATLRLARSHPGIRVIEAKTGRASQMNAGARVASGNVLLFLHADTRLPARAVNWICGALKDPNVVGGAFRTWTVCDAGRSWMAPLLHLADLRSRYSAVPYGDQALFVRADVFRRLGGFAELPLMEDIEFSRRLRRVGSLRIVPANVLVSGRRFLARPFYYTVAMNIFPILYRLGVPTRILASLYGDPR